MLIEFAVTNFRSFKDRQVLSLLPSGKIRERQIMPLQSELYPKLQALPTAVIYGPNNAGKSNFLRAVRALDWLVTNSGNFNSDKKLDANEFFGFDIKTKNQETIFEIEFIAPNQKRYNYLVSFNNSIILREELYVYNVSETGKITVKTLFEREKQSIKFPALKGKRESITFKENQLFLSRGDIAENEELKEVYSFFSNNFYIYLFTENEYTEFLTKKYAEFVAENKDNEMPKLIESILREIDTGILGVETNLVDTSKIKFPESTPQYLIDKIFEDLKYEIRTRHKLFSGETEVGEESLSLNEQSTGTRKLLGLIPLMLSALKDGDTIFIDEMNTSLHTEITTLLIDLFNNKETNPNNAQLIITTHDYTLLHKELYDKDQIFVVDKNKYGASDMYSFADITGLRGNNRLSEYYETGRLGGVPHIAKPYLQNVISQFLKNAKTEISEA
jgi:uncharacterized protein